MGGQRGADAAVGPGPNMAHCTPETRLPPWGARRGVGNGSSRGRERRVAAAGVPGRLSLWTSENFLFFSIRISTSPWRLGFLDTAVKKQKERGGMDDSIVKLGVICLFFQWGL